MKEQERVQKANEGKLKAWPKVAIIVLNWNGWQGRVKCLKSPYQYYELQCRGPYSEGWPS